MTYAYPDMRQRGNYILNAEILVNKDNMQICICIYVLSQHYAKSKVYERETDLFSNFLIIYKYLQSTSC